jgi:hypothetical protein
VREMSEASLVPAIRLKTGDNPRRGTAWDRRTFASELLVYEGCGHGHGTTLLMLQ